MARYGVHTKIPNKRIACFSSFPHESPIVGHTIFEVKKSMAKKGMKRPEWTHTKSKNDTAAVPQLQGKAKSGKSKANAIIAGTKAPSQKVYHTERPISPVYPVIDTDLGRDNVENHIPDADLQDL